jgi:hypothetical protein
MEMHYATILEALADRLVDKEAVSFGDRRMTWWALEFKHEFA